jgi:hypothetical protein
LWFLISFEEADEERVISTSLAIAKAIIHNTHYWFKGFSILQEEIPVTS